MPRKKEKAPTERQLRVAEEIRHVVSDTLLKVDLYDADVTPSMVMVTGVKVSPDFSWTTVQVHSIGQGADEDKMLDALNRHKSVFRKAIGNNIRLRITPDVRFCLDNRFDEMEKINALFDNPELQKDLKKDSV